MRGCQPFPVARNAFTTSGDKRIGDSLLGHFQWGAPPTPQRTRVVLARFVCLRIGLDPGFNRRFLIGVIQHDPPAVT